MIDHTDDVRVSIASEKRNLVLESAPFVSGDLIGGEDLNGHLGAFRRGAAENSTRAAFSQKLIDRVRSECGFQRNRLFKLCHQRFLPLDDRIAGVSDCSSAVCCVPPAFLAVQQPRFERAVGSHMVKT